MTEKRTATTDVQLAVSPLANVADLAETILTQSLAFCTQKMGLSTHQVAIELLSQGDYTACQYWHYSLAGQVAEHLGTWDEDVKAIYICDYDATPEDLCFGEATPSSLIHLIVWAQRKTAALEALIDTLAHALVECCADQLGMPKLSHLLDVQVVDDADVENRIGYGAMLSSLYNWPIQVWQR